MRGQKRQNRLPYLFESGESFFDPDVQRVLDTCRAIKATGCNLQKDELDKLPDRHRLELLALPLKAFAMTEAFYHNAQKLSGEWAFKYETDPKFMADLLVAVTNYHTLSEKNKNLTRKVADTEANLVVEDGPLLEKLDTARLATWAEVEEMINYDGISDERKFHSISADRIRAKEFYEEKERRLQILLKWQVNIIAFNELLKG